MNMFFCSGRERPAPDGCLKPPRGGRKGFRLWALDAGTECEFEKHELSHEGGSCPAPFLPLQYVHGAHYPIHTYLDGPFGDPREQGLPGHHDAHGARDPAAREAEQGGRRVSFTLPFLRKLFLKSWTRSFITC